MDNSTSIKEAIWNQFGASLDMVGNAIAMCPEENWDTTSNFWYVAYHCMFWTDYYLTTEPAKFTPPAPFDFSEFDPTGKKPDRTYSKIEVLNYLNHCQQKAYDLIYGLTIEKLNERWVNDYKNFSLLEIVFYNVSHIQYHAAQLNLLLRQTMNNAPAWVSQATKFDNSK